MPGSCPCNNPKCPQSPTHCAHCLCLSVPDVEPGQWIAAWGGPTGSKCCKCGHFEPQMSWSGRPFSVTTAPSIGTTWISTGRRI